VVHCFKRFDHSFTGPPQKSASAATSSYGSHHWRPIETEYPYKYNGGDQVHAANGSGMEIDHIGYSVLHSPTGKIHLQNILHVPKASKSLVFVNRLTRDNNVFIEFHPDHFSIKEH
jgi:nitroreductase